MALNRGNFGQAGRRGLEVGLVLLFAVLAGAPAQAADSKVKYGPKDIAGTWMGVGSFRNPAGPPPWQNTLWPKQPAFTPWGAVESRRLAHPQNVASCLPQGPIFAMTGTGQFPIKIATLPGQVVMLFENAPLPRNIYIDGRKHPDDPDPSWMGHSVGHWEGDVLVIDTIATNGKFRPINGVVVDASEEGILRDPRLPTSDQMHMTERLRLVGDGLFLEDVITVDDPKTYTKPFSATHYWKRRNDLDFVEYYCMENPRPQNEGYKALPSDAPH